MFVVMDVHNQLPLLGKDRMAELQFDVSTLINQATQILHTAEATLATETLTELSDVLKISWVPLREMKQILQLMNLQFHVFANHRLL